jgi:hypothetical protein
LTVLLLWDIVFVMAHETTKTEPESDSPKRAAYPYYPFKRCLEVAAVINAAGGSRGEVNKDVLAHELDLAVDSAVFSQLLGATKAFGLISGRGSYSLTELAKQFFYPTDDQQKRVAQLRMIKGPVVFEKLIERFDGNKLPSSEMLKNIIRREFDVADSWIDRTVSLFMNALKVVGVLDESGFLRFGSAMHGASSSNIANAEAELAARLSTPATNQLALAVTPVGGISKGLLPTPKPEIGPASSAGPSEACVWMFRMRDAWVRVETSNDMPRALWDKLAQYIKVLEPPKEGENE